MLTGLVVTLNEEKNISRCITSLKEVCDEVIVVDSYSEDNTVKIAEDLGAKVIQQTFLGDGPQKNYASTLAKNDWVILLDADESITSRAQAEIAKINFKSLDKKLCFSLKRENYIGNRLIKHAWGKDRIVRIFNRKSKNVTPVADHTKVVDNGSTTTTNVIEIQGEITHYGFSDYNNLSVKSLRLATRGADNLNKKISFITPLTHSIAKFIRIYCLKQGFRDGLDGLTVAATASYYTYLKYALAYEKSVIKEKAS